MLAQHLCGMRTSNRYAMGRTASAYVPWMKRKQESGIQLPLPASVMPLQIHRNSRGACYLYNLPTNVLEGRIQQDWMISEDGCLVLCLQTPPQQQAVPEKSVRSIPATQQVCQIASYHGVAWKPCACEVAVLPCYA